MLIGKALHTYHHKKAHMTCELSPYSCMPNTMSVGSMANVLKYSDLLYAPIEVKGDSEVHALSRCQMIHTEAKKRASAEFEGTLKKTGRALRYSDERNGGPRISRGGHAAIVDGMRRLPAERYRESATQRMASR